MQKYALVDKDKKVVNVIVSAHGFKAPQDYKCVEIADQQVRVGYIYNEADNSFSQA